MERQDAITFKGNKMTLTGAEVKAGDKAPDFRVIGNDLKEATLKDFSGKVKLISVTPSLDTGVCDQQLRTFNEVAANLSEDAVVINISMDLPFAIARFCSSAGIERAMTYSDHRDASFGTAYGVLIKELRLLTRAIFVIGKDDRIEYVEIVPEVTHEVDFEKALAAARGLL